jgi:hypothetical protein
VHLFSLKEMFLAFHSSASSNHYLPIFMVSKI